MAAVAADMKKKPQDLQKFVDILEGEFLDTAESLKSVTDSQWKQMGIPVGLANKIKTRLEAPEPTQKEDIEMIKAKLKSFDYRLIDQAAHDIIETARRTGARVVGPIPMPTKIEKYTVLSSPHVNKKAREQFEMRTHKRFIELLDPTSKTIDSLKNYNLPAGVDITIAA